MENVTISVLNECWKSVALARQREDGHEVQRIRNSPLCWDKGEVLGRGARRRLTVMRMHLALNIEALILYGPALFFFLYLLDVGSG